MNTYLPRALSPRIPRWIAVVALVPYLVFPSGLAAETYDETVASSADAWRRGQFQEAANQSQRRYDKVVERARPSRKSAKEKDSAAAGQPGENLESSVVIKGKSAIVAGLEQASVQRGLGNYAKSIDAFNAVNALLSKYELESKTKISRELATLLFSDADSSYRGFAFDGIMVDTFQALNYLALGRVNDARVFFNEAVRRQVDAVEVNRKSIEAAQIKLEQDGKAEAATKVMESDQFKSQVSGQYDVLAPLSTYKDYENPFTVYLDGLFFMANPAAGGSDVERSRKSFERVCAFDPNNTYVAQDLKALEAFQSGTPVPPTTYVIFETGTAISFKETKLQIPTFVNNGVVPAAFPVPKVNTDYVKSLTVTANGKSESTLLLSSMDSIIALELKKELPGLIRRIFMGTGSKAGLQIIGSSLGVIGENVASAFNQLVTRADCRSWYMLPKEIQLCRVSTPTDRTMEISVPGSSQKSSVTLNPGYFNVVYVKSTSASAPLQISQITLKP